jgi:N6-L-threonylcarbamoyladenine synthase
LKNIKKFSKVVRMIILGIETSCDDTGIALVEGSRAGCQILSNIVSSQVKIHAPYGGIVPNLAARAHLENIKPCLDKALKESSIQPKDIDLMTVTIGPGLIPSLLVGVNFAKALAYAWQKPIVGINHIEGHIYANWLSKKCKNSQIDFPVLCLVVSGGHTQLILMKNHGQYKLLGETRDDAAGEAFDKVAKLLDLGYPGGPIVSKMAKKGNPQAFDLPRPMIDSHNYDFSFSGLKTAVLYLFKPCPSGTVLRGLSLRDSPQRTVPDICASFQQAVIDVLISKTIKAAKEYKVKTVLLSGGVAANQELRRQLGEKIKKTIPNTPYAIPDTSLCTDNAAMIALTAYFRTRQGQTQTWQKIQADANLKLT